MLQNLLENAWKYSGRNPAPEIEFGCETLDGGRSATCATTASAST
jgi:hypothetical protein